MRSPLFYLLVGLLIAYACTACGVKGPPLPPEEHPKDVSTSPVPKGPK